MQLPRLSEEPVGEAELLLYLTIGVQEVWPGVSKADVPEDMRPLVLQIHARYGSCLLCHFNADVVVVSVAAPFFVSRVAVGRAPLAPCLIVSVDSSLCSGVGRHRHPEVVKQYLEFTFKFVAIFKHAPEFLPPVLQAMMSYGCVTAVVQCGSLWSSSLPNLSVAVAVAVHAVAVLRRGAVTEACCTGALRCGLERATCCHDS